MLLIKWLWHTAWVRYWSGPMARGCAHRPYVEAWLRHLHAARDCERRLGWRG